MLKIPKKLSVNLSMAIAVLLFIVCIAGSVLMPKFIETLLKAREHILANNITVFVNDNVYRIIKTEPITSLGRGVVYVMAYLVMAAIFAIDIMLFSLLKRVKNGLVFTEKSVALIRYISWCCFVICAAFCVLGIYFQLAFIVAFVALVLGTCLRVVKNVIEEATEIKSENDLTV